MRSIDTGARNGLASRHQSSVMRAPRRSPGALGHAAPARFVCGRVVAPLCPFPQVVALHSVVPRRAGAPNDPTVVRSSAPRRSRRGSARIFGRHAHALAPSTGDALQHPAEPRCGGGRAAVGVPSCREGGRPAAGDVLAGRHRPARGAADGVLVGRAGGAGAAGVDRGAGAVRRGPLAR